MEAPAELFIGVFQDSDSVLEVLHHQLLPHSGLPSMHAIALTAMAVEFGLRAVCSFLAPVQSAALAVACVGLGH